MNVFMYGADEKRRGVSCPSARVLPKLLSWNRLGSKYVSFKDCSFAVKKGREATARVVVVSKRDKRGRTKMNWQPSITGHTHKHERKEKEARTERTRRK